MYPAGAAHSLLSIAERRDGYEKELHDVCKAAADPPADDPAGRGADGPAGLRLCPGGQNRRLGADSFGYIANNSG